MVSNDVQTRHKDYLRSKITDKQTVWHRRDCVSDQDACSDSVTGSPTLARPHQRSANSEKADSSQPAWLSQIASTDVKPDRALPTWAIDLLMFGVPTNTPAREIWGRAVSIAMCAQARGWTRMQFINEFTYRAKRKNKAGQKRWSNYELWEQIQAYSRHGISGIDELEKAWEAAKVNLLSGEGLSTPEDLVRNAIARAWAWEARLSEGDDGMSVSEASVMSYVITEIERRQMTRVACPCRVVGEYAKLAPATAARTLKRLAEKGFLFQFSKGVYSKNPANRKAALYSLSDPFTLRVGGRGIPSSKALKFNINASESPRET